MSMHPEFSDASQYLVSIHSAPFLVDPFVFVRDPSRSQSLIKSTAVINCSTIILGVKEWFHSQTTGISFFFYIGWCCMGPQYHDTVSYRVDFFMALLSRAEAWGYDFFMALPRHGKVSTVLHPLYVSYLWHHLNRFFQCCRR